MPCIAMATTNKSEHRVQGCLLEGKLERLFNAIDKVFINYSSNLPEYVSPQRLSLRNQSNPTAAPIKATQAQGVSL